MLSVIFFFISSLYAVIFLSQGEHDKSFPKQIRVLWQENALEYEFRGTSEH